MSDHDLVRRSVNAVAWNYAGGTGRAVAQFAIQIALARMLGPEAFGQYAVGLAVLGIGWLIADGGFGAALIQKSTIQDEDISFALGWVLLIGVLSGGTIALAAPWLAEIFKEPLLVNVFYVCGLLILIQALANIPGSLMRRELDIKRLQIIQLLSYIIGFGVVGIFLARSGAGVWSLLGAFFVQTVVSLLSMYACVRHTLRPRLQGDAALRRFGLAVLGTNIANWAIENLDRVVVGKIWGMTALGAYTVALNLSRAPTAMLAGSVQSVAFASGSRVQDDPTRIGRGYLAMMSATMLITFPVFALLFMAADTVIGVLYGTRWQEAVPLFRVFALSVPLYMVAAITGPTLWALNAVGKELRVEIVTIAALFVGLWSASSLPLASAIWVLPAAYLIRAYLLFRALAPKIGVSGKDAMQAMLGGLFLTALTAGVWVSMQQFADGSHEFSLFAMTVCGGVCAIILFLSGGRLLGKDMREMLLLRRQNSGVARLVLKLSGL